MAANINHIKPLLKSKMKTFCMQLTLLEGSKKLLVYSKNAKTKLTDELELSFLNFSILEYCGGITLPASDYVNMQYNYVNIRLMSTCNIQSCNYVDMQHASLIISHVDIEKSIVNKIVDIMYLAFRG